MAMLVLDFETFFDPAQGYSLRSMTTLEYVLDSRFKAHGCSYAFIGGDMPDIVKNGTIPQLGWVSHDNLPRFFAAIDWSKTAVIGHNLFFDACILRWRYGVTTCRQWFDTLGMARYVLGATIPSLSLGGVYQHVTGKPGKLNKGALDDVKGVRDLSQSQENQLAFYAADDIQETSIIFVWLLERFPVHEWIKLHWCLDMWLNPKLRLNKLMLQCVIAAEQKKKAALVAATGMTKTAISSNQQFVAALEALGVEVPTKISKTTGKVTYATAKNDQEFAALLTHDDPRVRALVEARLAVKSTIDETRAERLSKVHDLTGGWLPVPLNYCGAQQTARLSGAEKLNLQNLGRDSMIRNAIEAPEGYVVVAADLSNIELRVNMVGCGQQDAVSALRNGDDLYCIFAEKVFGRSVTKANKIERMVGKVAELSLGYGAGGPTFQQMLWVMGKGHTVSLDEARRIVQTYRASHPYVKNMWDQIAHYIRGLPSGVPAMQTVPAYDAPVKFTRDSVVMPSGFRIKYSQPVYKQVERDRGGVRYTDTVITYTRFGSKGDAEGRSFLTPPVVIENLAQSLAAEVLWDMIVRIKDKYGIMPAMQVHDEIVFVVPEDRADEIKAGVLEIMHRAPLWWMKLPVAAEAGVGRTYGDAK